MALDELYGLLDYDLLLGTGILFGFALLEDCPRQRYQNGDIGCQFRRVLRQVSSVPDTRFLMSSTISGGDLPAACPSDATRVTCRSTSSGTSEILRKTPSTNPKTPSGIGFSSPHAGHDIVVPAIVNEIPGASAIGGE